jgi:hypothetical protein
VNKAINYFIFILLLSGCNLDSLKLAINSADKTIKCTNLRGVNTSYGSITSISGKETNTGNSSKVAEQSYAISLNITVNDDRIKTNYEYPSGDDVESNEDINYSRIPTTENRMIAGGYFKDYKFSQISYFPDINYISITTHQYSHDLFGENGNGKKGMAEVITIYGHCKSINKNI